MSKVKPETLFELTSLAQPVVSGEHLFYLETVTNQKENRYDSQIYQFDRKTKGRQKWGDGGTTGTTLATSPDGLYVSFISTENSDKKPQLVLMPIKGGQSEVITNETEGVSNYFWSKNSQAIYYQTRKKAEESKDEGSEGKELPKVKEIKKVSYKIDGAGYLPNDMTTEIKKIDLKTKVIQDVFSVERSIALAAVAEDETFLIFYDKLNSEDEWEYGGTVYRYELETHFLESLTSSIPQGRFDFAELLGNGCLLIGNEFEYAFVTQNKLYYYDFFSKELSCLTSHQDIELGDGMVGDFQQKTRGVPVMVLENDTFIVPVTKHGKIQLYRGNVEEGLTLFFDEALHLTDACVLNQQELLVTYSTPKLPSALGIIDLSTGKLKELYNPNEDTLKNLVMSESEMFWYKGADDWDIQGWYLPPVEKSEKHPAILYIHGGPQVCYGETFFHEMQVHAANGYGVILLNPRGGQGYGQAFVASILGDYGNKDYLDLMLGVDEVLKNHPEIDLENVFVAGGSYGGFMTNWMVGHTNRFKAAVTQRSISNWISFYGTSDVGAFFVKFQLKRELEDVPGLWKMSPLAYVHQVKTPTLVLHGEEDLRCPKEQGEQFFMGLKRHHVETEMILFPKSSHGLSRTGLPNLRIERINRISEWFERYK